jgi:ribosomal protein S18 acetylase RimI-like enzyme
MTIDNCKQSDFHEILADISDFWGSDRTSNFHHPMFIHEFGDTAFVIRDNGKVIAYLFGFLSQTEKTGYVHLIGVRQTFQNKGLGKLLYDHFTTHVKNKGYTKLKAITMATNQLSISFHKKIGMKLLGTKNEDGIEVVKDYAAPGQDRVVFEMDI